MNTSTESEKNASAPETPQPKTKRTGRQESAVGSPTTPRVTALG